MNEQTQHFGANPAALEQSYPAIGEYGVIGDCVTSALVSRSGSVDWLCLPMCESASWFARLLDRQRGGYFSIRPAGEFSSQRRYLPDTNVLETEFRSAGGVVRVIDCMPIGGDFDGGLDSQRELLRAVEVVSGNPAIDIVVEPMPDYARCRARLHRRGANGWHYQRRGELLVIRSEIPLQAEEDGARLVGHTSLTPGRRYFVSLSHTAGDVAVYPLLGDDAEHRLRATIQWWRDWCARSSYHGRYKPAVTRSALTLKLMCYARSGAVLAAPTTSLPEGIGSGRTWDYRYCWLRDASMTLRSFMDLGYRSEGEAFLGWLLHAAWQTWPQLQIMYTVHGLQPPRERVLSHLEGYRGSRPVRVGNAARSQLQLDVYGEVIVTAAEYVRRGGCLDRTEARLVKGFGQEICRRWREPDQGLWEVRGGARQHTHSKLMAWAALNAMLTLAEHRQIAVDAHRLHGEMDAIRETIDRHGFSRRHNSYIGVFDHVAADAALLRMAEYGYLDGSHPRLSGTFQFLRDRLERNGMFYRYDSAYDPSTTGEGAFGICSFWAAEYLAQAGRQEEAEQMFENLLSFSNDLGLFAEEIDLATGEQLGNFPQAFTHVGLIDTALTLERDVARGRQPKEGEHRQVARQ